MKKFLLTLVAAALMLPGALFAQKKEFIPVNGGYYVTMDGKKEAFEAVNTAGGKLMIKKGNSAIQLKASDYKYICSDKTPEIVEADKKFAAGDFDGAVAGYKVALDNAKEWTQCWEVYCLSQIAHAYRKAGKTNEAVDAFNKVKNHTKTPYPNDANLIAFACLEIAKTQLQAKKYVDAEFTVRKAINSDNQDVACEAYLLRGDILKAMALDETKTKPEDKNEALQHAAIAYFQAALLFKPVNKDLSKRALTSARDILADLGDPNKAFFDKKLEELGK